MADALPPVGTGAIAKALGARDRHERIQIRKIDLIVRHSAQPVRIVQDYRTKGNALAWWSCLQKETDHDQSGTFTLGDRTVKRLGYGAMQLAGPGVFGPPKDRKAALAVLREAVAVGVNHIDTSDFYGPHITNQIIREALHPYPDDLVIVTKVSARRGADGSWLPAMSPPELTAAVHDNLRNLGLDVLKVVNFRSLHGTEEPAEGSIEAPLTVLAELQRQGLIRHIGLSNVTAAQLAESRRICDIVCVQNMYNVAHRADDALIDTLAMMRFHMCRFFRLAALPRFSLQPCPTSRSASN